VQGVQGKSGADAKGTAIGTIRLRNRHGVHAKSPPATLAESLIDQMPLNRAILSRRDQDMSTPASYLSRLATDRKCGKIFIGIFRRPLE
jgi:hypothetical protein